MLTVFLAAACCAEFKLKQVLWPQDRNEMGLFGRSVAFNKDHILIGASMLEVEGREHHNGNQTGCVYPYDYNPATDQYEPSNMGNNPTQFRIDPEVDEFILPGTFGSKLDISDDGKKVIIGAPYSDVRTDYPGDGSDYFSVAPDEPTDPRNESDPDYTPNPSVTADILLIDEKEYYAELGAIYVFEINETNQWEQKHVSIPKTVVYKGGYGRALAGTSDMSTFAGSYYNKIPYKNGMPIFQPAIPQKIGKVFVETKNEGQYVQSQVIDPPESIFNKTSQRFGSGLNFVEKDTLYVTSQEKHLSADGDGDPSGIFVYKLSTTGAWDLEGNITAEESGNYDQFGLLAAVRDNGIAAIYGQDTDSKANDTLILSIGQNGATTTQQIIHSEEAVTDVGMFFCSAKTGDKNKNFLALVFEATIEIWQQDYSSDKYTLFQIIEDPKSVRDEKDPPYEDQFIEFGSDFSWDKETCTKFVFGSMSKGGQGIYSGPQPYGRAYIFTLTEDEPKNNDVAIIAGSTVAAVVVVAVIIVVVVVLLKKRRYRENAQQLEA